MEPAIIRFQPGPPEDPANGPVEVSGTLRAGGGLVLRYNLDRRRHHVRQLYACVRFHPGGHVMEPRFPSSAIERGPSSTVHYGKVHISSEIQVPPGTRQIEIWFDGTWLVGSRSNIEKFWDSRFGQNFWFDVEG